MKKRLAIYGTLIAVLTFAWMAAHYCATELSALVWHVRHGFHAEIEGIRLSVPLSYEAEDPGGLPSLSITKMPGHFSGAGGFIIIDFHSRISPEGMGEADARARQTGMKPEMDRVRLGERNATFAGRQGKCVEYSTKFVELQLRDYEIVCSFEGEVSVQLIGSAKLKNDFYNIIQSAEPVKRKT